MPGKVSRFSWNEQDVVLLDEPVEKQEPEAPYIGVDLDGTLAKEDEEFHGVETIGEPIPKMVNRVKRMLAQGKTVKIITARAAGPEGDKAKDAVGDWTERVFGQRLEVTNEKTPGMHRLYDNKAIGIETNTGELKHNHEFDTSQFKIPFPVNHAVRLYAEQTVKEDDLDGKGLELYPHVTIKYGLEGDDVLSGLQTIAARQFPIPVPAKFGKLAVFQGKDSEPDVLIAEVISPQLYELNSKVTVAIPHVDTHSEYHPHVTLAYVRSGEGAKYAGGWPLEGQELQFDAIEHVSAAGKTTKIPLTGNEAEWIGVKADALEVESVPDTVRSWWKEGNDVRTIGENSHGFPVAKDFKGMVQFWDTDAFTLVRKFNDCHDEEGKFCASGEGGGEGKSGSQGFKFEKPANVGGAHPKSFYKDGQGRRWLFKPARNLSGQPVKMMAYADEMASKIGNEIRPDHTVEAKTITLDGELGSVQRMIPDVVSSRLPSPTQMTTSQIEQVQQEQVTDWLISNHDAHPGQWIQTADGRTIGIDKTQAYKYFGKDKLSVDYHPNAAYGERPPVYNTLFKAVKDGKVQFDPQKTLPAIQKAMAIPNSKLKSMLKPYADSRPGTEADHNKFLDQVVERKDNLKADFEKFYSDILGKPFQFK